jgi:di/tricarboxylate transporter
MTTADVQIWATFAIIAVAAWSYVLEKASLEVTSVTVMVALLLFFHVFPVEGPGGANRLGPEALLAGFASPALITVMALLVIGQGLFQTGALEGPTRRVAARGVNYPGTTLALVLLIAGVTSAFMNNTPVVVMFIPVISALTARLGLNISKTIMPLSFISILGGMVTLIGSSTNLLVAGVAAKLGVAPIGFFDFAVPGLVLASIGAVYVLFVAPRLLRVRETMAEAVGARSGKQFIAQIPVTQDHPLEGQTAVAGLFPALKDMTVRMIQRGEHPILPPFEDVTLRNGDMVIVAATRNALTEALKSRDGVLSTDPDLLNPEPETKEEAEAAEARAQGPRRPGELTLAEAVIAPGSRMIGRRIEQLGLRADTGCIVLGIQRRSRMIRMRMSEIRLEAGDVVLILGPREAVRGLRSNRDVLLLEWSATELPEIHFAARARLIFVATVAVSASGLVPIVIAALAGAAAMIPAGCLNIRQASRAFDRRIYLLIAAAIAMAVSLEATGGAAVLAHGVVNAMGGTSPAMIMSALFLLIAAMTNLLSNNATAVLFTPLAINTAVELGIDPTPFVFTVIFAANCSFATPMAYQTNLLVMGPGHYRFGDFARAGLPLIFLMWLAYSVFAPWYYGMN